MPEEQDLHVLVEKLAEENEASYTQLQQQAGVQMNTESMRLNLFINFLSANDILSEEQRDQFEFLFQNKVKEALDGVWAQYRAAKAKQQLATPKKQSLIVPGGFKR